MILKYEDTFIKTITNNQLLYERLRDRHVYYIVTSHWYVPSISENDKIISAKRLYEKTKSFKNSKFYMMANSEKEYNNFLDHFDKNMVFFCNRHFNHGLKLDGSNIFSPKKMDKKYDFIFNGGLNKQQWKLKYINNLCILNKYAQLPEINCTYYNKEKLTLEEVSEFINMSKVGLMTTEVEGASWASLEFLLCGIPVISCQSLGGRDVFYNKNNSIIIDYSKFKTGDDWAVAYKDASDDAISRINEYDQEKISKECRDKCEEHKMIFINKIMDISNRELSESEIKDAIANSQFLSR